MYSGITKIYYRKTVGHVFTKPVQIKPTIGQESLHQHSNDNGVRLVNFATSKNLVVKSTMFPHRTFINIPGPPLTVRFTTRLTTY